MPTTPVPTRRPHRKGLRALTALSIAALLLLLFQHRLTAPVEAFKPNSSPNAGDKTHKTITREAIEKILHEDLDTEEITPSMNAAMKQIYRANANTDIFFALSAKYHFDDEQFEAAQNLLALQIRRVKEAMSQNDLVAARVSLGEALHTLQDFYSHSTWVEVHGGVPAEAVGVPGASIPGATSPNDNVTTCVRCQPAGPVAACEFDCADNRVGNAITTGYFSASNPFHRREGKCSHGGCFLFIGDPDEEDSFLGDLSSVNFGGINKDTSSPLISPHWFKHDDAGAAATEATKQFIRNLRDPDKVGGENALTEAEFRLLLGDYEPPLTLAIDVEINDLSPIYSEYAVKLLNNLRGSEVEPKQIFLVLFGKQGVVAVKKKESIDAMIAVIENDLEGFYSVSGNHGPRNIFATLSHVVSISPPFTNVVLFTDGSDNDAEPFFNRPADGHLLEQVAEQANEKKARIFPMIEGTSGFDFQLRALHPQHARIAELTAGLASLYCFCNYEGVEEDDELFRSLVKMWERDAAFLTLGTPGAAANLRVTPAAYPEILMLPTVKNSATRATSSRRVLLDPSVTSVTFMGANLLSFVVKRPDGSVVNAGDAGVEYITLDGGASISVDAPQSGLWEVVTQEGSEPSSVRVSAASTLHRTEFDFVREAGVPPHEGVTSTAGAPVVGRTAMVEASLEHRVSSARFELRGAGGGVLRTLALVADADAERHSFLGTIVTPGEPFSVFVTGLDLGGHPFERALPGVVTPQTLSIEAPPNFEVQVGRAVEVRFTVRNFGPADSFRLRATDDQSLLQPTGATEFALASQESRELLVTLRAPADAAPGTADTLSLRVERAAGGGAENYAFVEGVVTEPLNVVGGRVTDASGVGVQGAVVRLESSARSESVQTDAAGRYEFGQLPNGVTYTVTPSQQGFNFVPASRTINSLGADATADFTAAESRTLQAAAESLAATEGGGSVRLTVVRSGISSGYAAVKYATVDGTARSGEDYTAQSGTLVFAPGETSKSVEIPITDDTAAETLETFKLTLTDPFGAVFGERREVALAIVDDDAGPPPANLIDDAAFFVRQHYLDFLGREPDPPGLAFWVGGIESCGQDQQCREVKRVDTSAAFFLSIEFQETGYFAHRMYKAAFGDLAGRPVPVRREEFVADTRRLGDGVQVGLGEWQQRLEANKRSYAEDFVASQRFAAAFPMSLTPAEFVNRLDVNAGGVLAPPARDALVAALQSGELTRAQVLRRVAEDETLRQSELRKAFVLAQYFGYLRRDPDAAPDTNFDGYDFWLSKLNRFNGNYVEAEMVKAFIVSIEYRRRFGQ